MITISDNDLRQLLLYVQATDGQVVSENTNLRMNNRVRLAKITLRKLMKRPEVQRLMSKG